MFTWSSRLWSHLPASEMSSEENGPASGSFFLALLLPGVPPPMFKAARKSASRRSLAAVTTRGDDWPDPLLPRVPASPEFPDADPASRPLCWRPARRWLSPLSSPPNASASSKPIDSMDPMLRLAAGLERDRAGTALRSSPCVTIRVTGLTAHVAFARGKLPSGNTCSSSAEMGAVVLRRVAQPLMPRTVVRRHWMNASGSVGRHGWTHTGASSSASTCWNNISSSATPTVSPLMGRQPLIAPSSAFVVGIDSKPVCVLDSNGSTSPMVSSAWYATMRRCKRPGRTCSSTRHTRMSWALSPVPVAAASVEASFESASASSSFELDMSTSPSGPLAAPRPPVRARFVWRPLFGVDGRGWFALGVFSSDAGPSPDKLLIGAPKRGGPNELGAASHPKRNLSMRLNISRNLDSRPNRWKGLGARCAAHTTARSTELRAPHANSSYSSTVCTLPSENTSD